MYCWAQKGQHCGVAAHKASSVTQMSATSKAIRQLVALSTRYPQQLIDKIDITRDDINLVCHEGIRPIIRVLSGL